VNHRKAINFLRYQRRYATHPPVHRAAPRPPTKPLAPIGKRYPLSVLRECYVTVERVMRGFEHTLARRSKSFRLRLSESKYTRHQGAQEMARRARRGW
jgi:hypothetical protein